MAGDIRTARRLKLTRPELLDRLANRPAATDGHANARRGERLVRVRTAVAGQHMHDALIGHQLCSLNAGTLPESLAGILNRLEAQRVTIDEQEVWAAAEPRVQRRIQARGRGRNCDFHA